MLMAIEDKKGLDMKSRGATSTNRVIRLCVAALAFALGVCVCLAARPAVAWADDVAVLSIEESQQLLADVRSGAIDMEQANEQFMQAVYASEEPGETYEATVVPSESAASPAVNALAAEDGQDDGQNVNEDGQIVLGPDDVIVEMETISDEYACTPIYDHAIKGTVTLVDGEKVIPGDFAWKDPYDEEYGAIYFVNEGRHEATAIFTPDDKTYAPIEVTVVVNIDHPAPFVVTGGHTD